MSMAMPMVHETYAVPGLGDKAPDFTAQTTDGIKSLSDYKGQWVVLFSHPGDFTPVSKKQH
jgi:peroxiredoxin (alkyl hydroperoxide reductase subunit C)